MDKELISIIIPVITSVIVTIPAIVIIRWQAMKMLSEAKLNESKASAEEKTSAADFADKISDTAMGWFDRMEKRIADLESRLSEQNELIRKYESDRRSRSEAMDKMRSTIKSLERNNESLKSKVAKYDAEARKNEEIISIQDKKISELEERVSTLERDIEEYAFGINVLSGQIREMGGSPRYVIKSD